MNQILQKTYLADPEKWKEIARQEGGLEICDDISGQPLYTIGFLE